MAERIKIGLAFSHNENWIGGSYYILNLIQALHQLPDSEKPFLVVFVQNEQDKGIIESLQYPFLEIALPLPRLSLAKRLVNKLFQLTKFSTLFTNQFEADKVSVIFPFDLQPAYRHISKKIGWIPDFQEYFYPNFFPKQVLQMRALHHQKLIASDIPIVFSSQVAASHFATIYPKANNRTFVLNFATTLPSGYQDIPIDPLLKKYDIQRRYFISPNQFWVHKNHAILLEALAQMLKENHSLDFEVVFTGQEFDFRSPDYTTNLKNYVEQNGLSPYVKFLGFIDRKEQLQLMNHALAVIQPSLFEGWSTVVEDAKAMNQFLLVSDIPVHREQLKQQTYFFNPNQPQDLINQLRNYLNQLPEKEHYPYHMAIEQFARNFLSIASRD